MKSKIKKIMPDITDEQLAKINDLFSAKDKEIEKLSGEMKEANECINSFQEMDIEGVKASLAEWKGKYEASQKEWAEKIKEMKYEAIAKEQLASVKFSSNAAKKAFELELKQLNLPIQSDQITGFGDFLEKYKESDPGAFEAEQPRVVPGTPRMVSTEASETMSKAQRAFAEKGIDFSSVKNFNETIGGNR